MADVEEDKSKRSHILDLDDHQIPLSELCARFGTHESLGLSEEKARHKLQTDGYNTLSPFPKPPSQSSKCFKGYVALLWISGFFYLLAYLFLPPNVECFNQSLCFAISSLLVALISSLFPWFIASRGSKFLRARNKSPSMTATCIRDGRVLEIRSEELTLGDVIILKSGERVPADVRIIETDNFWVDGSLITGEGGPVEKTPAFTHASPLETQNLAFSPAYVIEGTAKGIVISVGMNTLKGQIYSSTGECRPPIGVFSQDLNNLLYMMITLGGFVAIISFICMFVLGFHWLDSIIITVGGFLAFIPTGELISAYLSLCLILKKLSKQNCVAGNWEALSTLGCASVICTDKTGTLTQNCTKVAHLWLDGQVFDVQEGTTDITKYGDTDGWKWLERAIALNALNRQEDQASVAPTENSRTPFDVLSTLLGPRQNHVADFKYFSKKVHERFLHSSSGMVIVASIYEVEGDEWLLIMKGDPKAILEKCSWLHLGGKDTPMDSENKSRIEKDMNQMMTMGEEVIALCDYVLAKNTPLGTSFDFDSLKGLRFIGFASLHDPPRANVPHAVSRCKMAGIKIIMMTGDSDVVSEGFARNIGLLSKEVVPINEHEGQDVARIVQGCQVLKLTQKELEVLIASTSEIIFTRVSPLQKASIVRACQNTGETVASIGDGLDDACALRAADIGIALGSKGFELQGAADLFVLNDDFASVVYGIEEGLLFFDNLSKVMIYSLSSNVPKMVFLMSLTILDIPIPLSGFLVFFIDYGINMIPAISLMNEAPEYSLAHRYPRRPSLQRLLNKSTIGLTHILIGNFELIAGLFSYFRVMGENGFLPHHLLGIAWIWKSSSVNDLTDSYEQEWTYEARTNLQKTAQIAFFITIAFLQAMNLVLSKTTTNSIFRQGMRNMLLNLSVALALSFGALGAVMYGMGMELQRIHLSPMFWAQNVLFLIFLFAQEECRKWVLRSAEHTDTTRK